jgi:hypothetical protein
LVFALPFTNASASSTMHPSFYMVFFLLRSALALHFVPIYLLFVICAASNVLLRPNLRFLRFFFDASVTIGRCVRYFSNANTRKKTTFFFANDAVVRKSAQQLSNWKLTTKYTRLGTKKRPIISSNYNVFPFLPAQAVFFTRARLNSNSSVTNNLFKTIFDNEYVLFQTTSF